MSGLTSFALVPSPANFARPPLARAEKPRADSGLHDRPRTDEQRSKATVEPMLQEPLSRSGTAPAPRWHATRLSSPFVAQVLGQVLAKGAPDANSARTAYANAQMRLGESLDRNI